MTAENCKFTVSLLSFDRSKGSSREIERNFNNYKIWLKSKQKILIESLNTFLNQVKLKLI